MPFTLVTWALLSGRFLYENYGFGLNISKWALKESQTRQTNFIKKKKKPLVYHNHGSTQRFSGYSSFVVHDSPSKDST